MPSFVEDIVSDLESEFSEKPSMKNWVTTSDGEIMRINMKLWEESPVLIEHSLRDLAPKKLKVSKSALTALMRAHESGTIPSGIQELYELLPAASELGLEEVTSKCFDKLRSFNPLDESVDFPSQLPVGTVMFVLKLLLDTPLRTADVYRRQLSRISSYCNNDQDVKSNAMNLLKQRLERYKNINLEGLPIAFGARAISVVIYKRMGNLQTGVIVGSELKPVNLFGNRIELEELGSIEQFYLKYGVYLLYRCYTDVYQKNLQDDSEPTKLLSNCSSLVSKGRHVFAKVEDDVSSSILLWVDDARFETIFKFRGVIRKLEFEDATSILTVLLSNGKLLVFKLENKSLLLLEEREEPALANFFLLREDMLTVKVYDDVVLLQTSRLLTTGDAESGRSTNREPQGDQLFSKSRYPTKWASIRPSCGNYFLTDGRRLELLTNSPCFDGTKTLLIEEEFYAMSELWLSP